MASLRQIAANQRNGRLGGPKSQAGKDRSRFNHLEHGLCAVTTVLPGESNADFEKLRSDLFQHWLPANEQERFEFEELARSAWKLLRLRNVETETWSDYVTDIRKSNGKSRPESPNECYRAVAGVLEAGRRDLTNYLRYERAIERSYYRAVQQLQKTQSIRRREDRQAEPAKAARPAPPTPPARPLTPEQPLVTSPKVSENGIRFVPPGNPSGTSGHASVDRANDRTQPSSAGDRAAALASSLPNTPKCAA